MSFLFLLNFVLSKEIVLCQKVILSVFRKKQRNEEIMKAKASIPKGLKAKQTVTSKLRREANKQEMSPSRALALLKRNQSS